MKFAARAGVRALHGVLELRLRPADAGIVAGKSETTDMAAMTREQLAELRETFDYNDSNGDGCIGFDEFTELLSDLQSGVSEEEARVGFAEIDTNGDGAIEFDEFVAWLVSA
jgi:Ca2+-binding EF-hand superfamily protein